MEAMTIEELKTHFSEVIDRVQAGETIQVLYGRAKKPVAQIVPLPTGLPDKRPIGLLNGKAAIKCSPDFKCTSTEEFLGLQ